jgi:hypothetical protein
MNECTTVESTDKPNKPSNHVISSHKKTERAHTVSAMEVASPTPTHSPSASWDRAAVLQSEATVKSASRPGSVAGSESFCCLSLLPASSLVFRTRWPSGTRPWPVMPMLAPGSQASVATMRERVSVPVGGWGRGDGREGMG